MTEKSTEKQLVVFKGASLYAQVHPGQERAPHPEKIQKDPASAHDRLYSIQVECSEELFKNLLKAGLSKLHELKEVEGKTYITVRGTKIKNWKDPKTGEYKLIDFGDPVVVNASGEPITDLIGNGSRVEVEAELTPDVKKALRLRAVKVIDLIPYVKPEENVVVAFEEGAVPTTTTTTTSTTAKKFF